MNLGVTKNVPENSSCIASEVSDVYSVMYDSWVISLSGGVPNGHLGDLCRYTG